MYFWTGVSTIAGVLRRKVWLDQTFFTWYPNFYVVLVAPPGIVSKSTTASIGMNLLKEVPGIHFGPDSITPQALITACAQCSERFECNGEFYPMSALTISSSELGNLLNTQDSVMINILIDLWDGRDAFVKMTKMNGNDTVEAPWVNMIACTTPSWLEANVPEYMIGGGLVSRMVFVYAEKKHKFVAYPGFDVPKDHAGLKQKLIADLVKMAALKGPFEMTKEAIHFGRVWYQQHWEKKPANMDDDRYGGYLSRKQAHVHKLAMVLAASRGDTLVLEPEDLATALTMVSALEEQMPQVFKKIGRTEDALHSDRFIAFCKKKGTVPYAEAYRYIHSHFPGFRDFEDMVKGCIQSKQLRLEDRGGTMTLTYIGE
jgi:hypothetical protein